MLKIAILIALALLNVAVVEFLDRPSKVAAPRPARPDPAGEIGRR